MHANRPWYRERINLFRFLPPELLKMLRQRAELRAYQKKQLVFKTQDEADGLFLLEEGQLKLSRFDERGREIILAILDAGELFGEECLGGSVRRTSDAEALSEVRVWRISRPEFERWTRESPELNAALGRQITQRLLAAQARLESMAFSSVPARLASTLLRLAEEHGISLPGGETQIDLTLTHQEIASLIASTRETTTTLLGQLRKDGLLRTESRRIILCDLPRLARRAQLD